MTKSISFSTAIAVVLCSQYGSWIGLGVLAAWPAAVGLLVLSC